MGKWEKVQKIQEKTKNRGNYGEKVKEKKK